MPRELPVTSAEEPDGGNLHVRFRRGPGRGNQPRLLNSECSAVLRIYLGYFNQGWRYTPCSARLPRCDGSWSAWRSFAISVTRRSLPKPDSP